MSEPAQGYPISETEYETFRSSGVAPASHTQQANTPQDSPVYCADDANKIYYSVSVVTRCAGADRRLTETEWRSLQSAQAAEKQPSDGPTYCWDPALTLAYKLSNGQSCGSDRRITEEQYQIQVARKEEAERARAETLPAVAQESEVAAPQSDVGRAEHTAEAAPVQQAAYQPELALGPYEITGSGTGFFVSSKGHVLTNHHVVEKCEAVAAITPAGIYEASTLDSNARFDLAVLKTPVASDKFASIASTAPEQGDNVYVIGYPLLGDFREIKITDGIVSGLSGPDHDTSLIQMTAAVQPGNSGGPLVSQSGAVVGVVVGKYSGEIGGGFYAEGINFAVAHEAAAAFLTLNRIEPKRSAGTKEMKNRDLMKRAEEWTIPLLCLTQKKAG